MPDNKNKILITKFSFKSTVLIKTWFDSLDQVESLLSEYLNVNELPNVGRLTQSGELYCAALAPGQFMVFSNIEDLHSELSTLFVADVAAVIDISHSRTGLELTGKNVAKLLNKGLAINLNDDHLPPGSILQSSIHSIGIFLIKSSSERYSLFSYTSFSESLLEWIIDSSLEYGYDFS